MRIRDLTLATICILAGAHRSLAEEIKKGTLTVILTTSFGGMALPGQLSITASSGVPVYSKGASGKATLDLPYGEYTVSFQGDFVKKVARSVLIDRPQCLLVLAADMVSITVDSQPHKPTAITVRVSPTDACRKGDMVWAKLVGVFRNYESERPLSMGMTLFEPVEHGEYVLIVIDGGRVRAMRSIATSGPITATTLTLDNCQAP